MKDTTSIYHKNALKKIINISGIYTVYYFKYGKNFRFKGERHNFWEMVYIDSGLAHIVADEKEFTMSQGEVFFHKPNEPHSIYTTNSFANSVILSFESKSKQTKALAGKIFTLSDEEKTYLNKIISETKSTYKEKIDDISELALAKKTSAPLGGEHFIKNTLELLLLSLLRRDSNTEKAVENNLLSKGHGKIVDNILDILNDKLSRAEKINLDEISFKLGFSKSYIKTQFKKSTGKSVIQYYIDLKIDKAKELLSQNKFTISEIADELGFGSIFYFSRQFKLHTDMSPSEYLNSIKVSDLL